MILYLPFLFISIAITPILAQTPTCAFNVSIPMRDGVNLTTFINIPEPCNQSYPVTLDRTPYGATGNGSQAAVYNYYGYASVDQNQRGCYSSGGQYDFWRQDGYDAYDTMEWIVKQNWSNGKIFTVGGSALGITQYIDPIEPNISQYLKAQYIIVGEGYMFETSYWGGAYRDGLIKQWLDDLVSACHNSINIEKQVEANENMTSWWANLEIKSTLYGNKYPNIKWPIIHYGGWWDIFSTPQILTYNNARIYSDPSVRNLQYLFMEALGHCDGANTQYFGFPNVSIAAPTLLSLAVFAEDYNHIIFKLIKKINVYVLGSVPLYVPKGTNITGNYWSSFEDWPTPTYTHYYLGNNKDLVLTKPTSSVSYTYLYDPSQPAPMVGGNNLFGTCGPWDQSKQVENRSDILIWTLQSNLTQPLALCGNITATLYVSSDQVDTDFIVSFNDVYPDGQSVQVRYGAFRMRWRNGPTSSSILMTPGQVYEITVDLWSTCQIIAIGHSLRVTVTSSSSGSFSINPNNGLPLSQSGKLIVAKNTIYTGNNTASYLTIPVVKLTDLPLNPNLGSL